MQSPETPKPATARDTRKPASNVEHFAGKLNSENTLIDGTPQDGVLPSNSLTVLADRIKDVIGASVAAEKTAIEKALEAGHLLDEARVACNHGDWLPFLHRAGMPERKAQRYMRLAKSGLKSDTVSDLGGIKAALKWAEGLRLPGPNELLLVSLNGFTSVSERWAAVWHDGVGHKFASFNPESGWFDELTRPLISPAYVLPAVFASLDNRHSEMSFRIVEEDFEFPSFEEWLRDLVGAEKATEFEAEKAEAAS